MTHSTYNAQKKEYESREELVDPHERFAHLLTRSVAYLTTGNTRKPLTAQMVLDFMPKLIVTHLISLVDQRQHISSQAIRRLVSFIRLFRFLIELVPEAEERLLAHLKTFIDEPEKRVKDHTPALGDLLAFVMVSGEIRMSDLLRPYLEEQLDR